MSRPMAADGTISISTPSALATGATADQRPAASTPDMTARIIPRIYPPSPLAFPAQCSEPHHQAVGETTDGGDPEGSPPPELALFIARSAACGGRGRVGGRRRGSGRRLLRGRIGGLRSRSEHPLDVRLHLLQLRAPVLPAVSTVRREVEHTVLAARGDVLLLERLVRPQGEALEELGVEVVACDLAVDVARLAVTAIHPDAGAVRHQRADVDHRIVALPRRIARGSPHVLGLVTARITHRGV